jgi:CRP/FNR family transcriptional regulator
MDGSVWKEELGPGEVKAAETYFPFINEDTGAMAASIPRGTLLMRPGRTCPGAPFLISGSLRAFKVSDAGREITLYRVLPGQACLLSCCCAGKSAPFPASLAAEEDSRALLLPGHELGRLFEADAAFRAFILGQYSARIMEVMELVEEVAFRRLDERLATWLATQAKASASTIIKTTHQDLADHLGSSREVLSRILKDWENSGVIELGRGSIELLDGFEKMLEGIERSKG